MFKTKKHPDQGAQRSYRHSFWKSDAVVAQPPSDAETIKFHRSSAVKHSSMPAAAPTLVDNGAIGTRAQPVPVTARPATTATPSVASSYPKPSQPQFHVVRSSIDARSPVATAAMSPAPRAALTNLPSQSINVPRTNNTLISSKPAPAEVQSHRTSASLNSVHTASTSRSSFDRISAENLQGSWGSNTLTTAPSSNAPRSTESLVRIPVANESSRDSALRERQRRESARYPLVETSDNQQTPAAAHAESTQVGEQASLPLPNSDYESPARVRSLRRSKGQINGGTGSSNSIRDATTATGRQSPAPAVQTPPAPLPTAQPTHRRSQSEMIPEIAYLPPQHPNGSADRHKLLARVMSASTPSKSSKQTPTASSRTMPALSTQQPRVHSSSQEANPNMTKLKQTTVPRLSTSSIAASSPSVEQARQLAALHSPTSLQATAESIPPWKYSKSPIMTSGPTYSNLTSQVMSPPNRASVASPRTLVSGSHHTSELPAILPSQQRYALSSAGSTVGKPYVEEDANSSFSTVTPGSPASHTVRALFSSFTSRPSHQPARASSLSNPPITAPEVDSPRLASLASGLLTPPPLPPQSTRPDAPQQSYTHLQSQYQLPTSPRHATPEFTKPNSTKAATPSRRDEVASPVSGLRSPSPTQPSIIQSYGLDRDSAAANPRSPSGPAHRALMSTPFHGERTLMSDSEYTTVTTSISVTRSVVQTAHTQPASAPLPHALERLTSSAVRKERATPVIQSASGRATPQSQGYPAQLPYPPQQQSQGGGIFNMFRPKSPRTFPTIERSASPAPVPPPSKTPPPRAATASPRRFVTWSIPILRHKPKKSISGVSGVSGASMEAVIGGAQFGVSNEIAMSSQGSLLPSRTPDPITSQQHAAIMEANKRLAAVMDPKNHARRLGEDDLYEDACDEGVQSDEPPFEDKMYAVQQWNNTLEKDWKASGKAHRQRPGVSFDLPTSGSDRDDGGMTLVSAVPAGGRVLRYGRASTHTHQFSDVESTVY